MSTLAVYQQSEFPAALKWQAIAFMRVEWPFIFTGDFKFITEPYPPELHPVHFVAAEGDSLIAYASILRLSLDHAGTSYKIYGLGNMFTFPPYRRQGYGSKILELTTDFIRRSDVDVSILFCDPKLEPFYATCGWETTRSSTRIGVPGDYEPHEASKMMLFVSAKGRHGRTDFEDQPFYVAWHW